MDKDSLFTHHLTSPFLQWSWRKGAKEWGDYLKVKSYLWSLVWCLTNVNSSFRSLKGNPATVEAEFFHQWRCEELGHENNSSKGRQEGFWKKLKIYSRTRCPTRRHEQKWWKTDARGKPPSQEDRVSNKKRKMTGLTLGREEAWWKQSHGEGVTEAWHTSLSGRRAQRHCTV